VKTEDIAKFQTEPAVAATSDQIWLEVNAQEATPLAPIPQIR
jgi:hypothetical protein